MPRYYFHSGSDVRDRDRDGIVLPNLAAAQRAAARHVGELLRDDPEWLLRPGRRCVEVSDRDGMLLFNMAVTAADPLPADRAGSDGTASDGAVLRLVPTNPD